MTQLVHPGGVFKEQPPDAGSFLIGPRGAEEGTLVGIALGQLESGAALRANLAAIDGYAAEATCDGAALVASPE